MSARAHCWRNLTPMKTDKFNRSIYAMWLMILFTALLHAALFWSWKEHPEWWANRRHQALKWTR